MYKNKVINMVAVTTFFVLAACGASNVATKTTPTPAKPVANTIDFNANSVVYFDFDKSSINANESAKLNVQAEWLKANPTIVVTVEGHTDYLGTREYNLALGERRASAVKSYLVGKGADTTKIKVVSFGKDKPLNNEQNDKARAENRRAVSVK